MPDTVGGLINGRAILICVVVEESPAAMAPPGGCAKEAEPPPAIPPRTPVLGIDDDVANVLLPLFVLVLDPVMEADTLPLVVPAPPPALPPTTVPLLLLSLLLLLFISRMLPSTWRTCTVGSDGIVRSMSVTRHSKENGRSTFVLLLCVCSQGISHHHWAFV